MDDLFQYLIYGIIIISFLSSFFKKKEPPKQTPVPRTQKPDSFSYQQSTKVEPDVIVQKKDDYDILRELENMFKGNLPIPDQQKPKQAPQYDEYNSREIKDKDLDLVVDKRVLREVEDKNPIGSRPTFDEKMFDRKTVLDKQRQTRVVDPKIEAGAKAFERVLAGPRKQRAAVSDFNRKLKNPRTVREYILFSEILGKPKALRR